MEVAEHSCNSRVLPPFQRSTMEEQNELGSRRRKLEGIQRQGAQQWGKLTNDDLDVIEGRRKELAGRLQQRYGYAKDQAEQELDEFLEETDWDSADESRRPAPPRGR